MSNPNWTRRTLGWHVVATFLLAIGNGITWAIVPLLARLRFDAGDWQTYFVTAAIPTFLGASIFWDALLRRISVRNYLLIHCVVAILPIALMALAQNFWHLLACQILAAAGAAGWTPVFGALLKHFYPDTVRGRIFGVLMIPFNLGFVTTTLCAGHWLSNAGDSFRVFLPLLVLAQIGGIGILILLAGRRADADKADAKPAAWSNVLAPLAGMGRTLFTDRLFLRYEAAFMTYGAGFMICEVLLPVLVTDRLDMSYDDVAESVHLVQRGVMLLLAFPMGWVLDRIGAPRTSAISFALLALYPIGLTLAGGRVGLACTSVLFGIAMAGVFHGWMLGPVALARTPEKVTHYLAIHATLVGVRGVLFQGLGIWLYRTTSSFEVPLIVASGAFAWGAWQMWRLHRVMADRDSAIPIAK